MNRIIENFNNLMREALKKSSRINPKSKQITAMLRFSAYELEQMEDSFKELFCADGGVAYISKYQVGKRKPTYEIRYYRHGINLSVTDKDLKTAKALFIQETHKLDRT